MLRSTPSVAIDTARGSALFFRLRSEQGNLERAPLRRREVLQRLVSDVAEKIDERREPERPFGLRRPRHQDIDAALTRIPHATRPEARLPDPRLALDAQRARSVRDGVEEREHALELAFAPDNLSGSFRSHAAEA
jgi:hypothetical protein